MWSSVIDQSRVKKILQNIFSGGKISHAYIFFGSEGTGKDALAIEFAKLVNCDNPVNGNEACGKCRHCAEIGTLRSPLARFVIALPSGKNESDDDKSPLEKLEKEDFENYIEHIDLKSNDNYYKIFLEGANDIRISSIRQIKREIYLTGKSGKKKVFIISKADMMNPNSANSLLKILEEPPGDSVLILTTSKINSLLPTIIGRCQTIKFDPIPKDEIIKYIREKIPGMKMQDAEFYAELSEGSITKCNEIIGNSFLELRDKVIDYLAALLSGQFLKMGNDIDFVTGKKDKGRVRQFLSLLEIWFRDVINESAGNDSLLVNKDKSERIKKFNANFDSDNYGIISAIEESIRDIDSNVFPELLLQNLSHKIKSLVRKKAA